SLMAITFQAASFKRRKSRRNAPRSIRQLRHPQQADPRIPRLQGWTRQSKPGRYRTARLACHSERSEESRSAGVPFKWQYEIPRSARNDSEVFGAESFYEPTRKR